MRRAISARLAREHDNLQAALRWSTANGEAELAHRLVGALWTYWYTRPRGAEGARDVGEDLHVVVVLEAERQRERGLLGQLEPGVGVQLLGDLVGGAEVRGSSTQPTPRSRAMSIRCTSLVPSPISRIFASR